MLDHVAMGRVSDQHRQASLQVLFKCPHYFPIYESHFRRYVNRPVTFLEIGVAEGGSLQLWKRYLGPYAQVVGIDIAPLCKAVEEDQIAVRVGDQGDAGFLDLVLREFGPPDIVLDDGSHQMADIRKSFAHLYPRMSPAGVYMVEDLQTAYWDEHRGGLRREGTFRAVQGSHRRAERRLVPGRAGPDRLHQEHAVDALLRQRSSAGSMSSSSRCALPSRHEDLSAATTSFLPPPPLAVACGGGSGWGCFRKTALARLEGALAEPRPHPDLFPVLGGSQLWRYRPKLGI